MAKKLGGGGNAQENYDPNTGKYISEEKAASDLLKVDVTGSGLVNSLYRKRMENISDKIKNIPEDERDGTYDIDTGEKVNLKEGIQVSFSQKSDNYSDEYFDELVRKLEKLTGSKAYVGCFEGSAEISYCCKDKNIAYRILKEFYQESVWNNKKGVEIHYSEIHGKKSSPWSSEEEYQEWVRKKERSNKYNE